jgi:hypothetical protein
MDCWIREGDNVRNSISDNSAYPFERSGRAEAIADRYFKIAFERETAQDPSPEDATSGTALAADRYERAENPAAGDPLLYITPMLERHGEHTSDDGAEGALRRSGYRVYAVRDSSGGRQYYFQPDNSAITVSLGSSDGSAGGLDVLGLAMRIRAAEARYRENYRPQPAAYKISAPDGPNDAGIIPDNSAASVGGRAAVSVPSLPGSLYV